MLRWIIGDDGDCTEIIREPRCDRQRNLIRPRLHAQSEPRKDGQPPWRRPVGTISEAAPLGRAYVPVHRGARGH